MTGFYYNYSAFFYVFYTLALIIEPAMYTSGCITPFKVWVRVNWVWKGNGYRRTN